MLSHGVVTLQEPMNFDTDTGPLSIDESKVNIDGQADLTVANFDSNTRRFNTVSVLLGNGDGTFREPVSFGAGVNPTSVAIGDLNGDGRPDLVVTNFNSDVSALIINTTVSSRTSTLTITKTATG